MSFLIVYHKNVKSDIFEAKIWYKNKLNGLEKRFATQVKKTIDFIVKNPFLFQVKYKNVRAANTEIFPYGLHYIINENNETIIILGIFHNAIDPNKWKSRM